MLAKMTKIERMSNVLKLLLMGRKRHAVLLHHAQECGSKAGYCMDHYLVLKGDRYVVDIAMVKQALKEMEKLDRVTILMYRSGFISQQGLGEILDTNKKIEWS